MAPRSTVVRFLLVLSDDAPGSQVNRTTVHISNLVRQSVGLREPPMVLCMIDFLHCGYIYPKFKNILLDIKHIVLKHC